MKRIFYIFNLFDILLWATSIAAITVAFCVLPDRDYLTLSASLIGVTALIFLAKGHAAGQALTIVFAVFYGIVSYYKTYYGEMITYLGMSAPAAAVALVCWLKNPYKDKAQVKVANLTKPKIVILLTATAAITVAFYFILCALGNADIAVSTVSVATSFLAAFLSIMRSEYYALAYAANDIVLVVLWSFASVANSAYVSMVICFAMFLLNDVYGFINWQRMKKRQRDQIDEQNKNA